VATTSLVQIYRDLVNDRPLWPPGAEIAAQAFDAFDAWRRAFDPEGEMDIVVLSRIYERANQ
jgi:hypothetical protein